MTPIKALRKYCVWCANQPKEADLCPAIGCPLHLFRHGRKPRNKPYTVLKAIRLRCLNCSDGSENVKRCEFNGKIDDLCDLYTYRLGKNPVYQGRKGRAENFRLK